MSPEEQLKQLGIELPAGPAAVGAYRPWITIGNLVITSGQLPWKDGKMAYAGRLGAEIAEEDGFQAARLCAINALAQLKDATGSLDQIVRIVRVEGYVHCAAGFRGHPRVLDGASELLIQTFGESGRHTRIALGISEMPLNAAVQLVVWAEQKP